MNRACLAFALFSLACANARSSNTCHVDGDCASGMHCVSGRCFALPADAGRDGASVPSDAGHDAATAPADAFVAMHDAGPSPVDAGRDAAIVADAGRDGGRDAGVDAAHVPSTIPLLFSEYVEGTANNKAIEIVNLGTARFDLTQCHIDSYANGSSTATTTDLVGSLSAGAVFTMCNSGATGFSPSTCTVSNASAAVSFNGNDALALVCSGMTVDVIGQIGVNPGTAWGTTVSTANQTLRRNCSVTSGDTNGDDAFDPASEWTSAGADVFDGLGTRGCP